MFSSSRSVDLTTAQLEVIESALHTQEKILAVQNRAGGDHQTQAKLGELKSTIKTLRRQMPSRQSDESWAGFARKLFI